MAGDCILYALILNQLLKFNFQIGKVEIIINNQVSQLSR